MSSKKLLVVGELNIDLILNGIQGFPKIGTEIVADNMNFTLGSSSAIMASNISALGVDTSFCGMVGIDDFGDFVLRQLKEKGVNTRYINKTNEHSTGITVIMNYDQDRANVTYCGAMNALTINDIPWDDIRSFDHFHFSNYFLQDGIKKDITAVFKKAKDAGLTTSLDLQFDPNGTWDFDYKNCLPFVDVFLPNESEILGLTGKETMDTAITELKPYANIIALKMGENGSRLISKEMDFPSLPFKNKHFKDAIGAGDSFNSGFIARFLEEAPLKNA
ncbi:carbohydrate kinase family protein [Antarcticibacterium sp. 1MA-6-2]|uniref:carbohydrate kinase family protein n=1 Tax=Antarcticibacterium sp. 1MA-6-2 TaxID=2908210 RepID=UPI001F265A0B|nr:carbohydrate kinase family protein [Antarcticibacterium sp. 1MA-6-2]UJH90187.1 carbohydrate kinase family protein [Antarcticibacterium sp. 1MA-6-2]